jgi:prepilin peptidase CpaA
MPGTPAHVVALYAALALVVLAAAAWDMRTGKIPNLLTFPAMLAFVAAHAALSGLPGLWLSLTGLGAGLTFLLVPHLFGYLGAGDVKLMAVVGAGLGVSALLTVFLFTSIAGGAHIMLHLWLSPAPSPADPNAPPAEKTPGRRKWRVRYGAAIAVGTVAAMAWNLSGRAYLSLF